MALDLWKTQKQILCKNCQPYSIWVAPTVNMWTKSYDTKSASYADQLPRKPSSLLHMHVQSKLHVCKVCVWAWWMTDKNRAQSTNEGCQNMLVRSFQILHSVLATSSLPLLCWYCHALAALYWLRLLARLQLSVTDVCIPKHNICLQGRE